MDINSIIFTPAGLDAFDNGAWVGDIPEAGNVKLKVRAIGSPVVQRAINAKREKMRAENKGDELTQDQSTQALYEVLAEVAIEDWSGLTSGAEELKFDRKLVVGWAKDRTGIKFMEMVFYASRQVDQNANAYAEKAAKNSSPA